MTSPSLSARVESGRGVRAQRGELTLSEGRLRFHSYDDIVFDVPFDSVRPLVWPWYSFSSAFQAAINGNSYFISFIPRSPSLNQWYGGLVAGRYWRAVMEGRTPPRRGPLAAQIFLILLWLTAAAFTLLMAFALIGMAMDSESRATQILCGLGAAVVLCSVVVMVVNGARTGWRMLRQEYPRSA